MGKEAVSPTISVHDKCSILLSDVLGQRNGKERKGVGGWSSAFKKTHAPTHSEFAMSCFTSVRLASSWGKIEAAACLALNSCGCYVEKSQKAEKCPGCFEGFSSQLDKQGLFVLDPTGLCMLSV